MKPLHHKTTYQPPTAGDPSPNHHPASPATRDAMADLGKLSADDDATSDRKRRRHSQSTRTGSHTGSKSNPLPLLRAGLSLRMWTASKIPLEKSLGPRASISTLSGSKWRLAVFRCSETAEVEEDPAATRSPLRSPRGPADSPIQHLLCY